MRAASVATVALITIACIQLYRSLNTVVYTECFTEEIKVVQGSSMEPLFSSGDSVRTLAGFYDCNPVKRGDVVLIEYPGQNTPLLKRVHAIPGDNFYVFEIESGWGISVNEVELKNTAGAPYRFTAERVQHIANDARGYQGIIPDRYYLVLGEDTAGSMDSTISGLFSGEMFTAKVSP